MVRRTRTVMRELRRLERSERTRRVWQPMSAHVGIGIHRAVEDERAVVLIDTTISYTRMDPGGRTRASGKRAILVAISSPFATVNIRWTGLQRTVRACREAATALEVMAS